MRSPRYADQLELWLVSDNRGWRAFPAREVAEASMGPDGRLYRGPASLGRFLEVCSLEPVTDVQNYLSTSYPDDGGNK